MPTSLEKNAVQLPGISQTQGVQLVWQRVHQMEILNGQHLLLLRFYPLLLLRVLALTAMAIPAGIVSVVIRLAGSAGIELASKGRGSADPNSVELSDLMAVGLCLNV